MTTIKEINCHEFDSKDHAVEFIKDKHNDGIVVPFHGLFIDGHPNILPLDYFFTDQVKSSRYRFNIMQLITKTLQKWAPDRLGDKSVLAISRDIFKQMDQFQEQVYPYPWLENAVNEINQQPLIVEHKRMMKAIIFDAAHWMNTHFKHVVFYGVKQQDLAIANVLISRLNIDIHWILPSHQTKCTKVPFNGVENWLLNWGTEKVSFQTNQVIYAFESIEDECNEVLRQLKLLSKNNAKFAIVSPNQNYSKQLQNAALQVGIDVFFGQKIRLDQTQIGSVLKQIIQWLQLGNMEALYEALLHPIFNHRLGIEHVRQAIHSFLDRRLYYNMSRSYIIDGLNDLEVDPILTNLISIKSFDDLKIWMPLFTANFDIQNVHYLNYSASQIIEGALTEVLDQPFDYLNYLLGNVTLDTPELVDPLILCIKPEDISRYPSHEVVVLGASQESWYEPNVDPSYLQIESLESTQYQVEYRYYLLQWILKSDQLISVSFAKFMNQKPAHLMEGVMGSIHSIINHSSELETITRQTNDVSISVPKELSPSSIELYQKCPYAFFLKYILNVKPTQKTSYQLLFGTMFHKIIEQIAIKNIASTEDVKTMLSKSLTPLQAAIFYKKLTKNDWDLHDILVFFTQNKSIQRIAEEKLSITLSDMSISGRPDVLNKQEHELEIIDVKTGQPPSLLDIKRFHYIQLGVYALMAESKHPNHQINCSLFSKNNKYSQVVTQTESKTSLEWQYYRLEITQHLQKIIKALKNHDYLPSQYHGLPSYHTNQCRVCDYYSVCHAQERHQRS